jgi:dCTP deaminase
LILTDSQIKELVQTHEMISPFFKGQIAKDVISYGLSSFGYDARLDNKFKFFPDHPVKEIVIDPKNFDERACLDIETTSLIIPPNSFALGRTIELFKMPRDVVALCVGKSTYARCGLIVNVTPLEPGWKGHVTLELTNSTPQPIKVYANEGICQFMFFKGARWPDITYADRHGKYQDQTEITLPRIKK